MFKAVMLMQLRVMMYIESKKSAVFMLDLVLVICTYKQNLNELQPPDLTGITGISLEPTTYIYSFATQPCMSGHKQGFFQ